MTDTFGCGQSHPSPSVSTDSVALTRRQKCASSSGAVVDRSPGEVEGDSRFGAERAPVVLSGEERAPVNAAMTKGSTPFLDGVVHGASRTGGVDLQRTVDSLQRQSTIWKERLPPSLSSSRNSMGSSGRWA